MAKSDKVFFMIQLISKIIFPSASGDIIVFTLIGKGQEYFQINFYVETLGKRVVDILTNVIKNGKN